MKNITSLLLLAACALVSNRASAALVAEWEFNSYNGGSVGANNSMAADFGSQAGAAQFNDGSLGQGASVTGTAANSANSVAGNAFEISATGNTGSAYNSYTFSISGTGLSGFVMTYETKGTADGVSQQWSYDAPQNEPPVGPTFLESVSPSASSSYNLETINFSGITALNNATSVNFILDIANDAASWNGNMDFDNFAITAVPEPVNTALACFGLGIAVVSLGRFYVSRRRRIS